MNIQEFTLEILKNITLLTPIITAAICAIIREVKGGDKAE